MIAYIEDENIGLNEHDVICELLTALEGKTINHRTLSEKRLSPSGLRLVFKYGMYYLEGKRSHLLAHHNGRELFINVESFKQLDGCHGEAARKRIGQINEVLNNPVRLKQVVSSFEALEEAYKRIAQVVKNMEADKIDGYHFPPYYSLIKLIQPETGNNQAVDFNLLRYVK